MGTSGGGAIFVSTLSTKAVLIQGVCLVRTLQIRRYVRRVVEQFVC